MGLKSSLQLSQESNDRIMEGLYEARFPVPRPRRKKTTMTVEGENTLLSSV